MLSAKFFKSPLLLPFADCAKEDSAEGVGAIVEVEQGAVFGAKEEFDAVAGREDANDCPIEGNDEAAAAEEPIFREREAETRIDVEVEKRLDSRVTDAKFIVDMLRL